jgi:starch synthase
MKIVFVCSEVFPYAKTGGLADVCAALPAALEKLGHEVVVIMPRYRGIKAERSASSCADMSVMGRHIRVYFIRNREYFERAFLYGGPRGDYPDNLSRFSFFCHEVMKLLKEVAFQPDIIHCHDWQAGLVPVLLKERQLTDPFFQRTRSVFTIHNLAYQGVFPKEDYSKLGLASSLLSEKGCEQDNKINFLKAGIVFSDRITTVSARYAREIQTEEFGCGLENVLKRKRDDLTGILNGLDYDLWDPGKDPYIYPHYDSSDPRAKAQLKEKLQAACRLASVGQVPLFGFIGRLFSQKGLDLIESAFSGLMQRPLQAVFLGVGEERYQKMLLDLARKNRRKCAAVIRYNEELAHLVYAGSDFFLMPSVYEPCGLAQMISWRYGTIPLVSNVGGLADTVVDLSDRKRTPNGIVMSSYSVSGFLEAVDRALGLFHEKDRMQALIAAAMNARLTWDHSAEEYVESYEACLRE